MRISFIYLVALLLGLFVTPYAMQAAFVQRQGFAIGGEILIPLLFVGIAVLGEQFKENYVLENAKEIERHKKSTHRSAQTEIISLS